MCFNLDAKLYGNGESKTCETVEVGSKVDRPEGYEPPIRASVYINSNISKFFNTQNIYELNPHDCYLTIRICEEFNIVKKFTKNIKNPQEMFSSENVIENGNMPMEICWSLNYSQITLIGTDDCH
ncbi:hypothetical protein KQX54_019142 [Cotesia glomerata]|uniref:Uncharacterized protein n=1 Tax=Cotesia glomerata TaxID=32391 RepID=A0AAV7IA83_COTGL|nr:hypothetical protein KQX54_019142 [Cotesia glomerata]